MQPADLSKQWIFKNFIHLVSQQEMRDSKFAVRMREEMQKFEKELGEKSLLTLSDIHLIACIGDFSPINVTSIAEKTGLTKGSITRISKKLLKLELVKRQQINDNKKEVHYSLTPKGQKVHLIHNRIHHEIEERFMTFLDKYTNEQLDFARSLMQDLAEWDY
ncbi:MarR family transcriptional regulator [Cohnella thailandensis]|uniref:MarR family transcriptional regulator n=1 Tax=Cohnella thailandensis TaxID=557557 RepID=A0A841ST46_9BACL|nr:MarR family transcriptional regulator [Cohnella thailandensis]MBB6633388.1 MarR family transcriptional regulator [Cohnella thailandensis]MBP1977269.1 DNA-binding MarR family transcriptional regulator [Cohnella thailandensis]